LARDTTGTARCARVCGGLRQRAHRPRCRGTVRRADHASAAAPAVAATTEHEAPWLLFVEDKALITMSSRQRCRRSATGSWRSAARSPRPWRRSRRTCPTRRGVPVLLLTGYFVVTSPGVT